MHGAKAKAGLVALQRPRERRLRGELRCLMCGRFLGLVEGEAGEPVTVASLVPDSSPTPAQWCQGLILCGRCGGRAMLEELEPVLG